MSLTPLLIRVRDSGLSLRVREETGGLVYSPCSALIPELREELVAHKPELLEILTWRESTAHDLLKNAAAYLAEFYVDRRSPDCDLMDLDSHEEAIDAAIAGQDMFALRVAVREWVLVALAAFKATDCAKGAPS